MRRVADAERYKLEVEAAGQANAITTVYSAIRNSNPDDKLLAIQYLETLKMMANGTATKIFLPYEAKGVLAALGGIHEIFRSLPPELTPTSTNGSGPTNGSAPPAMA